jgi:hypothetical protein
MDKKAPQTGWFPAASVRLDLDVPEEGKLQVLIAKAVQTSKRHGTSDSLAMEFQIEIEPGLHRLNLSKLNTVRV